MKRIISLLLILVLALCMVACGNSSSGGRPSQDQSSEDSTSGNSSHLDPEAVPDKEDYLETYIIDGDNFLEYFTPDYAEILNDIGEGTGEYRLIFRSKKYNEGLLLYKSQSYDHHLYIIHEPTGEEWQAGGFMLNGEDLHSIFIGLSYINKEDINTVWTDFEDGTITVVFVKDSYVKEIIMTQEHGMHDGIYDPCDYYTIILKDGTELSRIALPDNPY